MKDEQTLNTQNEKYIYVTLKRKHERCVVEKKACNWKSTEETIEEESKIGYRTFNVYS